MTARTSWTIVGALAMALSLTSLTQTPRAQVGVAAEAQAMPTYDHDNLMLPNDYRTWIFVGASLGLSYSENGGGAEMFHETLIEPSAYRHFIASGTFREGTMLALLLHPTGENVMPARQGRFAKDLAGLEMAVKDSAQRPEGWAYYNFGGANGLRTAAQAMPTNSCYACHKREAKLDNVFMQFYPLLADRAPRAGNAATPAATVKSSATTTAPSTIQKAREVAARATPVSRLAVRGLDPVMLIEGRDEMGKPEIVQEFQGFRYQFVSEPNRVLFVSDPVKYAIRNDTCLVIPGAQVNPDLYVVYEKRLYAFATQNCVIAFKAAPNDYLPKER
jgi:YHS domain-containing protein